MFLRQYRLHMMPVKAISNPGGGQCLRPEKPRNQERAEGSNRCKRLAANAHNEKRWEKLDCICLPLTRPGEGIVYKYVTSDASRRSKEKQGEGSRAATMTRGSGV